MSCIHCDPKNKVPGDAAMEACVVSSMMQSPDAATAAREIVGEADFGNPACAVIFQAVTALSDAGCPVSMVSVCSWLDERDKLTMAGGNGGVGSVLAETYDFQAVRFYARQVALLSRRRKMLLLAAEMASIAQFGSHETDWKEGLAAVMAPIMRKADLLMADGKGTEITELRDVTRKYLDYYDGAGVAGIDPPVSTGISSLDALLSGGIRREYIIIGGKQGHGKTLLAMQLAGHLANDGRPGLVVGYEMSDLEVFMRDLARESAVRLNAVMGREQFESGETQSITRTISRLTQGWDVGYIDNPRITIDSVIAHARSRKREGRLDWMVVDYLQLIPRRKGRERGDEILMELSGQLNLLRKELQCTIIAPVQLNDDGLIRDGRAILDAPQLFIRIEMDEHEGQDGLNEVADTGKLRILKNRFGANNRTCSVKREGEYQRFVEYDPPYQPPQPKKSSRR